MKKLYLILSSFLLFIFIFSSSKAQTFYGYAVVVDADTIKIGNYKIRLFGIDAPEKKQFCENVICLRKGHVLKIMSLFEKRPFLRNNITLLNLNFFLFVLE